MRSRFFGFPNPVNEVAVRITAAGVVAMAAHVIPESVCVECSNIWLHAGRHHA
jgi:hypothetical protein